MKCGAPSAGARTFLSAATWSGNRPCESVVAAERSGGAADRNVRAPRLRLCRAALSTLHLLKARLRRCGSLWLCAGPLLLACGCATSPPADPAPGRAFDFEKDTFAYPNELVWEYHYDANGKWTTKRRDPKPTYALRCFVLGRSACQFFHHARFDPEAPVADPATYRRLIRRVVSSNPRKSLPESDKTVIPGYGDLRTFSRAEEKLLKAECGGTGESYFQRGHWRMVFPFSRHEQELMADQLLAHLQPDHPVAVHLLRFPQLTINHALVLFGARVTANAIEFAAYDPNQPAKPTTLTYDRATRTFLLPANDYFPGGRVDVYEVYHKWDY